MPDSLHIIPHANTQQAVSAHLMCWSNGDPDITIRTDVSPNYFAVHRSVCNRNYGPLRFKPDGPVIDCPTEPDQPLHVHVHPADVAPLTYPSCHEPEQTLTADWAPAAAAQTITVTTKGAMRIRVRWGDDTTDYTGPATPAPEHTYTTPGTYAPVVTVEHDPTQRVDLTVVIKDHSPHVYAYSDPDDDWRVLLWVDEQAGTGSTYRIDYGDGSPIEEIRRDPPPYPRQAHDYTATGRYLITVTDTGTRRTSTVAYDVAEIGMLFSFPADDRIPHLVASRLRVGATWRLDWGDGTTADIGTVPANASVRHGRTTAMEPGTYTVTITEIVNGTVRRTASRDLTIPSVWNLRMQVSISWRRTTSTTRTITVTPLQTPSEVVCLIDWGDGTATETVGGGTAISHDYAFPFPKSGYLLTVTERSGDERHFSRLMGEPSYIGAAHLSAFTAYAVDLYVEGIPGLSNADWYVIDWGDGITTDRAAVGAHWLAWHAYSHTGDYTISIDGPGMDKPITRSITIPDYPLPKITVAEDTGDATRRTAKITVDNQACGGDVELRFGDGSAPVNAGPSSTTSHPYTTDGSYTIIATCLADRTARTRGYAVIPYGPVETLKAHVNADPDDATGHTTRVVIDAWDADKTISVGWGDGTSGPATPPTASHFYDFDGPWTVTVAYDDGSESLEFPTTIPWGAS